MKGISPIMWTYMTLALLLIILVYFSGALFASIDAAVKNNARLQAQEIAGVISMMKTSDSQTLFYTKGIPENCVIEISDDFVTVTIKNDEKETENTFAIEQSDVTVHDARINCEDKMGTVKIKKEGNFITVS
ncbi:MAG: hypothetical protein HY518_04150 [Candidatus Aenigmarchaeota archaeon]|nr:hypothetical protein [Candidatus Aenigmarchaeota archaeon]